MTASSAAGVSMEQLWRENQSLRTRAEQAERDRTLCRRHVADMTRALGNKHLPLSTRAAVVFTELELEHRRSRGEVDARGFIHAVNTSIADQSGQSTDSITRGQQDLEALGCYQREVRRFKDPESGDVKSELWIRRQGTSNEVLRSVAQATEEEATLVREQRKKRRTRKIDSTCRDCGSDDTQLVCRSCGSVHRAAELLPAETDDDEDVTTNVRKPQPASSEEGPLGMTDDTNIMQFARKPQPAEPCIDDECPEFVKDDGCSAPTNGNGNGHQAVDGSFFVAPNPPVAAVDTYVTEGCFAASVEVMVERPPSELLEGTQFVGWRIEARDGKPTKIPVSPLTGHEASSIDSSTWGTLEQAKAAVKLYGLCGVGRMLRDDFTVFEIDDCRNAQTGEIDQDALGIMRRLDSYTEISPSGEGLHIWLRGKKPTHRCRHGRYECYDHARYFTLTCQRVTSVSGAIENRPAELAAVCRVVFPHDLAPVPIDKPQLLLNDSDIYEKLAGNQKFQYLDRGDSASYPSHSEADMAYFCMLARFTSDAGQIERIARGSNRQREKWDKHSSYLRDSIERAIQFVGSRP